MGIFDRKPHTDEQCMENIQKLIAKYVYHEREYQDKNPNSTFCHDINPDRIPFQGWKLHISAASLQDYENLLKSLCPDFDKLGVQYKVTKPELLYAQMQSEQVGKAITVYMTPSFNYAALSQASKDILNTEAIEVPHEHKFGGRIYARYGVFREGNVLLSPEGRLYNDPRQKWASVEFVKQNPTWDDIGDFYNKAKEVYHATGNYKDYIEEVMLGVGTYQCENNQSWDSRRHNFIALEFQPQDKDVIKSVLRAYGDEFCGVIEVQQNFQLAMVHNTKIDSVLKELNNRGIACSRPDWDRTYNISIVPAQALNDMQQAVQSFNSNHMVFEHDAAQHMETMTLDNGMLAVKYDTTLDKAFEEMCRDLRTQARDVVIGDTEAQIQASWGQIHNSIMKTMLHEQTHGHELTQNLDGQDFSRADWT